jgi:hypothetical protein
LGCSRAGFFHYLQLVNEAGHIFNFRADETVQTVAVAGKHTEQCPKPCLFEFRQGLILWVVDETVEPSTKLLVNGPGFQPVRSALAFARAGLLQAAFIIPNK